MKYKIKTTQFLDREGLLNHLRYKSLDIKQYGVEVKIKFHFLPAGEGYFEVTEKWQSAP